MLTKHLVTLAALLTSSAAFAFEPISVDVSRPAGVLSRAAVAAEAERALAAGEIKNGPLVDLYVLVEPAQGRAMARQAALAGKQAELRVASAPSNTRN